MIEISAMWLDVMRHGDVPFDELTDQQAPKWWLEHERQLDFAFNVLWGAGLADVLYRGDEDDQTLEICRPTKLFNRLKLFTREERERQRRRDANLRAQLLNEIRCNEQRKPQR